MNMRMMLGAIAAAVALAGYSRALVGSGSADYLWILSRTPGLSETAKSELLAEARRRGYDTGKLIWVRQGKDSTTGSGVK